MEEEKTEVFPIVLAQVWSHSTSDLPHSLPIYIQMSTGTTYYHIPIILPKVDKEPDSLPSSFSTETFLR